MGVFLNLFKLHSDYNSYITGQDAKLPNVSYCEDKKEVHYNPTSNNEPISATFNVEDDSVKTLIYGVFSFGEETSAAECYSKIEIDGVEISLSNLDADNGYYQLSNGIHIIQYTLLDPTSIIYGAFNSCESLTTITLPDVITSIGMSTFEHCNSLVSVNLPNNVKSIDVSAFSDCESLVDIIIPNSIISINASAFNSCTGLTSITIESTTPPSKITADTFSNTNNCPIYVPSESVETYKSASGWSTYASRIQAIP